MMKKSITLLFAFAFGVIIFGLSPAFGEEDGDEFVLEEITVTAQKRAENSQNVPISISTITGDDLANMGGTTLKDSLSTLSGVTIMQVNEGLNVSIRGMDNDGMPGDSASMIGITLDGVASNNFATGYSGLYDVSRVEVLSGPQGTLYSRNSGGGVVNMITNNPNVDGFDASGSVEIGNYNTLNAQGMVNIPVDEASALRMAYASTDRDGYIDNGTDDNDTKSMRLKYLYNVNEDLSAILTYENIRTSGKGQGRDGVQVFEDEDDTSDPWTANYDGKWFYNDIDNDKFYLNLTWNTGIGQLTFLPSFSTLDRVFGTPDENRTTGEIGQNHCIDTEEETSGELRLNSSEDSPITWVAGIYYYKKTWDNYSEAETSININKVNNPTKAAFANLTYPVTDRFRITVGGRYTEDHEKMTIYNYNPQTGEVAQDEKYDNKNDHTDYKLAVEYDVSENSMIWLENSTGYRQGYRGSESQSLDSYQIGAKNRFLDQRLQVNATAFYYDYTNYQVRSMVEYVSSGGDVMMDEGIGTGDATVYGLDFDAELLLTRNDLITFSASYLNSEIEGLTMYYNYLPPSSVYDSSPINNSPEWTVAGSYKHEFYLPNGGTLSASYDFRFRTEYYCSFQDYITDPEDEINWEPDHIMSNAALNYAAPSGKWSINTYIKNIEDHAEKVGKMMESLRLSPPRTYGVVLSVRY